jgi:hypothetical protein
VDRCQLVLRVSVTKVALPKPQQTKAPTVCEAKVLEVLKGPPDLKTVTFCFVSYTAIARDASPVVVGNKYIAFLCNVNGKYWVFEGAAGVRPVATDYNESRTTEDGKMVTDTFDHTNYLRTIRRFELLPKVSITDLLANREKYSGRRVEVTGYYESSFEYSGLYQRKEDSKIYIDGDKRFGALGAIHNGLWIWPVVKPGCESDIKFVKEGTVRLIGVFSFRKGYGVGHFNGWPAQLSALELFEEQR